ncbi:MAG: outer membrane protein transport protein [Flavobacteriales bacterium]|nr:outer membrane protein transport protein [Flavobacteriales bacterium]
MRILSILLVLQFCAFAAQAQNQYWAQQYGAQSALLGGAVVAGSEDNSALYYNPALLSRIENGHLSVSANAYGFEFAKLKNGAGNGVDLTSFQTLIYPQIISGMINLKKAPKFKLAYGILTRFNNRMKLNLLTEQEIEITSAGNGLENYKTNFVYELSNIEQWGALSVGYVINEKFSVGISQFVSYLNNDSRLSIDRTVDVSADTSSFVAEQVFSSNSIINHVGLLYKIGFSFQSNGHKLGITATSTSIKIWGRANGSDAQKEYNMDRIARGEPVPFLANQTLIIESQNRKIDANYKLPWSFALGYEYQFTGGTRIMFASEVFLPLKRYTVFLDPEPVIIRPEQIYQGTTIDSVLYKTNELQLVVNAAVAVEQPINDKFSFLASFRTDFNSTDFDSERNVTASLNTTFWNSYHFTTGITWKRTNSKMALGLSYSLGESAVQNQPISFTGPINTQSLLGNTQKNFEPVVHGLSVIVGYTYYLPK